MSAAEMIANGWTKAKSITLAKGTKFMRVCSLWHRGNQKAWLHENTGEWYETKPNLD